MSAVSLSIPLLGALLAGTPSEDWGSFRGPGGCGVSPATDLPAALDPDTTLSWTVPLARGYSSPLLTEDAIIVTVQKEDGLATVSLDPLSGDVLWEAAAPEAIHPPYQGPNSAVSSTPATDGDLVYVLFGRFGVVSYDFEGNEVWRTPMGPFNVPHSISTSPVLTEELVVIQCDQDTDSHLIALDKETGEERWRASRPGVTHGYATPTVYQPPTGPAQIIVNGAFQLAAYSAEDGAKVWWVNGMAWSASTLPVVHEDLLIVHSSVPPLSEFGGPKVSGPFSAALEEKDQDGDGKLSKEEWTEPGLAELWFLLDLDNDELIDETEWDNTIKRNTATGGLFAVKLTGKGDVTDTHVAWSVDDRRVMPGYCSPLVYQGTLYLLADGGILTTVNLADGAIQKRERIGEPDQYYASLIAADDKIIAAGQSGQLTIVQPGAEWEMASSHSLGEEIWSTPAVGHGRVIVRTQKAIYCFESRDSS